MRKWTAKQKQKASNDLVDRLARFAAGVISRTPTLPTSKEGKHLRDQLMRSGTAPGAHYSEARGAQSRDDFVYKISLGLKELREAVYWLKVAYHAEHLQDEELEQLIDEGEQLAAILTASQTTARKGQS